MADFSKISGRSARDVELIVIMGNTQDEDSKTNPMVYDREGNIKYYRVDMIVNNLHMPDGKQQSNPHLCTIPVAGEKNRYDHGICASPRIFHAIQEASGDKTFTSGRGTLFMVCKADLKPLCNKEGAMVGWQPDIESIRPSDHNFSFKEWNEHIRVTREAIARDKETKQTVTENKFDHKTPSVVKPKTVSAEHSL